MVRNKLGIDAVFFLRVPGGSARIPLIYFARLEKNDPEIIAELHRLARNLGEAPLLFVTLPDRLFVYSNYKLPKIKNGKLDRQAGLIDKLTF